MSETLTIPNVFPEYRHYLLNRLADFDIQLSVVSQVPKTRPVSFIRVIPLATARVNLAIAEVTMTHECWAATQQDADDLAGIVYAVATAANLPESHAWCPRGSRGTVAGPYPSTDPDSGTPRAVFSTLLAVPVAAI